MDDDELFTECPICCEPVDIADSNFKPCSCSYKVELSFEFIEFIIDLFNRYVTSVMIRWYRMDILVLFVVVPMIKIILLLSQYHQKRKFNLIHF